MLYEYILDGLTVELRDGDDMVAGKVRTGRKRACVGHFCWAYKTNTSYYGRHTADMGTYRNTTGGIDSKVTSAPRDARELYSANVTERGLNTAFIRGGCASA